jgi:hypothetical protein
VRYCRGFVRGYCLNVYLCLFVLTEIRPSSSHNLGNVPRLFFFLFFSLSILVEFGYFLLALPSGLCLFVCLISFCIPCHRSGGTALAFSTLLCIIISVR